MATDPILVVDKLMKYFPITRGIFAKTVGYVKAVDDIGFQVNSGETFGLVGESGSGKSTTAQCVLRLYTPTSGTIRVAGMYVNQKLTGMKRSLYHKTIQAVFQDPNSSLSPRMRVGDIIAEPLVVNATMTKAEREARVKDMLSQVGLPLGASKLYPHEFSGGQRQRIAIARSLILNPKLVVLDEPVSSLDVSIRAQVMNLLKDLQESLGVAYLLIVHDLANVRYMSNQVGVMYLGKIIENAPSEELFTKPLHPYTQALLSAALPSHPNVVREEITLSGEIPSPINLPKGCRFHPRCFRMMKICTEVEPKTRAVDGQHEVCCHLYGK
jgi:oligopeptide/dipeptide ABC transporter ATP-binding protein